MLSLNQIEIFKPATMEVQWLKDALAFRVREGTHLFTFVKKRVRKVKIIIQICCEVIVGITA